MQNIKNKHPNKIIINIIIAQTPIKAIQILINSKIEYIIFISPMVANIINAKNCQFIFIFHHPALKHLLLFRQSYFLLPYIYMLFIYI